MADSWTGSRYLKQGEAVLFAGEETVGEFKTVARLDALHADAPACMPSE